MEIEYGEIKVVKITRNVYRATTITTKPMKSEVNMDGKTEEIAKQKLENFLANKPYKHLDNH